MRAPPLANRGHSVVPSFGQSPFRAKRQHNNSRQTDGGSGGQQQQQCSRLLQRRPRSLERRQVFPLSLTLDEKRKESHNPKTSFLSGNVNVVRKDLSCAEMRRRRQRWKKCERAEDGKNSNGGKL